MFAIFAAVAFLLALLHVSWGIDLAVLGLLFVALHLAIGPVITIPFATRRAE